MDLLLLITALFFGGRTSAFVIAPPWANTDANPCSSSSWQLVFWPPTGKCYQIFSKGPCPDTQELAFNPKSFIPECRCPQDLPIYWPATDRCYSQHSKGPCEVNQYLEVVTTGSPVCIDTQRCDSGMVFWPAEKKCYELYTQGPCHKGDLLIMNPLTAEPYCGCDPLLLKQYYYSPTQLCYEHFTKGPCEHGSLFSYNHTSDTTECVCNKGLINYYPNAGQCFQVDTKGPCGKGQVFKYDKDSDVSGCQCKQDYVYWERTSSCYRAYTPGPCRPGQFLVAGEGGDGFCSKNPCSRAHLYFPTTSNPSHGHCHKVGSRGPCPEGELVVFEAYSGKSYRGACGCSSGYNQNYWSEDGKCYEWYSQGPCPESFLFKYNKQKRSTECVCDTAAGFVFWNETNKCYRIYSQGPCPDNAWLIPTDDLSEVYCECKSGYHFSPVDYTCDRTPVIEISRPVLSYLRNHRFETNLRGAGGGIGEAGGARGSADAFVGSASESVKTVWGGEPSHTGVSRFGMEEPEHPDIKYFWHPNSDPASFNGWGDRERRTIRSSLGVSERTRGSAQAAAIPLIRGDHIH